MSICWQIMICLDDLVPFLFIPGYYFALPFPPFSAFLFEIMGTSPLVYDSFVLLWGFLWNIGDCSSSDEEFFW